MDLLAFNILINPFTSDIHSNVHISVFNKFVKIRLLRCSKYSPAKDEQDRRQTNQDHQATISSRTTGRCIRLYKYDSMRSWVRGDEMTANYNAIWKKRLQERKEKFDGKPRRDLLWRTSRPRTIFCPSPNPHKKIRNFFKSVIIFFIVIYLFSLLYTVVHKILVNRNVLYGFTTLDDKSLRFLEIGYNEMLTVDTFLFRWPPLGGMQSLDCTSPCGYKMNRWTKKRV